MGNRIYLHCTDFDRMPNEEEWDAFFLKSDAEHEAQGCLPYFWLCLFDSSCIKIDPSNRNGFEDDERPYAYLIGERLACVERLKKASDLLSHPPPSSSSIPARLLEWTERLTSSSRANIIVRTEELDWMGEEGALEMELTKALNHHETCLAQGRLRPSQTIRYLCGLAHHDELLECEPEWLFGHANDGSSWPLEPRAFTSSSDSKVETAHRPWWKFW